MKLVGFGFGNLRCFADFGMRRTDNPYENAYYNGLVVGTELPQRHEFEVFGRRIPDIVSAGDAVLYLRRLISDTYGFSVRTLSDDETVIGKLVGDRIGFSEEVTEKNVADDRGRSFD